MSEKKILRNDDGTPYFIIDQLIERKDSKGLLNYALYHLEHDEEHRNMISILEVKESLKALKKIHEKKENPTTHITPLINDDRERFKILSSGKCIDCEPGKLLVGSTGGVSVNVKCDTCKSMFNLTPVGYQRIGTPKVILKCWRVGYTFKRDNKIKDPEKLIHECFCCCNATDCLSWFKEKAKTLDKHVNEYFKQPPLIGDPNNE